MSHRCVVFRALYCALEEPAQELSFICRPHPYVAAVNDIVGLSIVVACKHETRTNHGAACVPKLCVTVSSISMEDEYTIPLAMLTWTCKFGSVF